MFAGVYECFAIKLNTDQWWYFHNGSFRCQIVNMHDSEGCCVTSPFLLILSFWVLAIRLDSLDLPKCFSIECQGRSDANLFVLERNVD